MYSYFSTCFLKMLFLTHEIDFITHQWSTSYSLKTDLDRNQVANNNDWPGKVFLGALTYRLIELNVKREYF